MPKGRRSKGNSKTIRRNERAFESEVLNAQRISAQKTQGAQKLINKAKATETKPATAETEVKPIAPAKTEPVAPVNKPKPTAEVQASAPESKLAAKLPLCRIYDGPTKQMLVQIYNDRFSNFDRNYACFELRHDDNTPTDQDPLINVYIDQLSYDGNYLPTQLVIEGSLEGNARLKFKSTTKAPAEFECFERGAKVKLYYNTESRSGHILAVNSNEQLYQFKPPKKSGYKPRESYF